MIKINENFLELQESYLFATIGRKVAEYSKEHPDKKIIKLGIGDVTRPIPSAILDAMHKAVDEMGFSETFRGYGPEQGYDFLREKIRDYDYKARGVDIDIDEIPLFDQRRRVVRDLADAKLFIDDLECLHITSM